MRIVILGTGYVSSAYARALIFLGHQPLILSRSWFDYDGLANLLHLTRPDLVINGVGYTGTTIDDCEPVAGRTVCYQTNISFLHYLVQALKPIGCKLIHLSTGCIFNGSGPYKEEDQPNNGEWWPTVGELKETPFYVQTKWAAEREAIAYPNAYIFRIRMPFCSTWHPRNLLTKLSTYEFVLEGLNSITFLDEFCMRSLQLVDKPHAKPGIYHAAYPTPVLTSTIAKMLLEAGLRKIPIQVYPPDRFLADGHLRRSQAVLCAKKFEENYGAPFGDPLVGLRWCIDRMKAARASFKT